MKYNLFILILSSYLINPVKLCSSELIIGYFKSNIVGFNYLDSLDISDEILVTTSKNNKIISIYFEFYSDARRYQVEKDLVGISFIKE